MAHDLELVPSHRNGSLPELFDTAKMPPDDRLRLLRDAIGGAAVPVEIEHHVGPDEVSARGAGRRLGTLSILMVRTTPFTVRRTVRLARADSKPSIVVELQLGGRRSVVQGNRRTLLSRGDLILLDCSQPYLSTSLDRNNQLSVRIPRPGLALTDEALTRVAGLCLGSPNPVANLAATYLRQLVGDHRLATEADLDVFEAPTIELIRAVVASQLGDGAPDLEPMENTLALRIMEFARQHLTDPDLTATKIARAHNISVRHLYTTLSRSGVVLGEWIRVRRLEGCRRELARSAATGRTISAVAHGWGFGDPTHFSRTFREAFGMSPREWRALHQDKHRAHLTETCAQTAHQADADRHSVAS
ncbi:AraC-like DNA-binding protein [Kribbella steppae]|uniref:AraC-like DNA-binding protein n=1 Tax=Kribbella steppae TaxID=2512223 RepID=A0A4R2H3H7_9ACTN|nr:helix-turn-helix domain-containing protein [Kribbella steppae]TCO19726.1 AraC-like DNA-binding protein [Kribbella steppae]